MEKAIELILQGIIEGGSGAIIAILLMVIGFLVWYINHLVKHMQELNKDYHTSMTTIIDKYQAGQINVIQALNEIKIILAKIEVKV